MLRASLTRVAYGVDEDDTTNGGSVNSVVVAFMRDQRAHDAHDNDPAFKRWDAMADEFQVAGPSVWGGRTLLEIGQPARMRSRRRG
jgi:hypothetical protein